MSAWDQYRCASVREGSTGPAKQGMAVGTRPGVCLLLTLLKKSSDFRMFSGPGTESQPPAGHSPSRILGISLALFSLRYSA